MQTKKLLILIVTLATSIAAPAAVKKRVKLAKSEEENTRGTLAVLWQEPRDIASRSLYYGPGGLRDEPHGPFTFIKEDLKGTNPKFWIRDRDGVKWKVKLGAEARPETVATRLVWAVGYFTNEDYFLPVLRVDDMPRLRRRHAGRFIEPDGSMRNVRLKRDLDDEKKIAIWHWRNDPFQGTREWNGLRVMMALINNWDLKDENNGVYIEKQRPGAPDERVYMVTDLGASFGTAWLDRTHEKSKGNLLWYERTKFITALHGDRVNFEDPRRPAFVVLVNPHEFFSRLGLRWIGRKIPVEDAEWIGGLLAKLSDRQICEAFQAAGYSPREVRGFAAVVESRIAALNRL